MNCNHCGQEMERATSSKPAMCPNVDLFMDAFNTDTLTGKAYEADASPIHCTDQHKIEAELEDNADWHFLEDDDPNKAV